MFAGWIPAFEGMAASELMERTVRFGTLLSVLKLNLFCQGGKLATQITLVWMVPTVSSPLLEG